MVKKRKNNKVLIGSVIIILTIISIFTVLGFGNFGLKPLAVTYDGNEDLKYAIPHLASYKCEPVQDKYGISISIPDGGAVISRETVGFYTNGISNIQIVSEGSWIKSRVRYSICDENGLNCGSEKIIDTQIGGAYSLSVPSLNLETESLKLYSEEIGTLDFWNWYYWDGNKIQFDGKVFGLRLYSTTRDPAGAKICTTSCNLDCPDIGYREKLLFTDETKLGFYETSPYIEYWETIDYDLNAQGGATIYNPSTNKFCFAGAIYTGAEIKMDNGVTYLYPETNTRENRLCCPGATMSSTYSDQICQDDYTWKTVEDTDKLTCMSDYNCPEQGGVTCQYKTLSGYRCTDRDENNVGICQKESGIPVECCINSDCVRDQVCDIATHTCKGGTTLPVCGDGKIDAGEQCDDGNSISGDGCSSICESELKCRLNSDCDEGYRCTDERCIKIDTNYCADCDAYAKGLFFGWASESQSCEEKIFQGPLFCIFAILKLLAIPIFFILSLIFGFNAINKIMKGEYKALSWSLAIIVGGLVGLLTYFFFYVGVVILIIIGILRMALGFIPGLNLIKRRRR